MTIVIRGRGIGNILDNALADYQAQQQERQSAQKGRQKKASSRAAKASSASAARSGASGTLLTRGTVDPSRNLSGKTLLGGG